MRAIELIIITRKYVGQMADRSESRLIGEDFVINYSYSES